MTVDAAELAPSKRTGFQAFLHVLKHFLPYLIPVWDKVLLRFLISNSLAFLGVCIAMIGGKAIDEGLIARDYDTFLFWLGLGLVLGSIAASLLVINGVIAAHIKVHLENRFRFGVFSHLQKHSLRFFESRSIGEHMYRTNDDTTMAVEFVGVFMVMLLERLQTVVIAMGVVRSMNSTVALLVLAYMLVFLPTSHILASFVRRMCFTSRAVTQASFAALQESLAGYPVDKMFGTESRSLRTYADVLILATRYAIRYMNFDNLLSNFVTGKPPLPLVPTVVGFMRMFFLHLVNVCFFGLLVMKGSLSTGEYVFLGGMLITLVVPVEEMIGAIANMRIWAVPAERMLETLDVAPEIRNRPEARQLEEPKGVIEFEKVSFCYAPGLPDVVRNLSFRIEPNKVTAFVGMSGAGKTTVFNLLMRFYDPTAGRILIDGTDLRDYDLASYRDHVGLVLQESHILSATLRDNILIGRPQATENEVLDTLRRADMEDTVRAMPEGLDTVLSEAGNLSVGDRQRISIARVLLRNPEFLYLDEPTASLDPETARQITRHLDAMSKGRTTVVIAHSLESVLQADQIIAMDHGIVVGRGTHESLLATNALYQELWVAEREKNRHASDEGR
jgi:ABC-type multidrug transport system fused ATPase/permease subunit